MKSNKDPFFPKYFDKYGSSRAERMIQDEETLGHMAELIRKELSSNFMAHQTPHYNVSLGSDAYWALESTRVSLRRSVAFERKRLLQLLVRMNKMGKLNSKDHSTVHTRAVIVLMPGRRFNRKLFALVSA